MTYIITDIGATKTRIAASHDLASFDDPVILDTPQGYGAALELVSKTAQNLAGGELKAIAVGKPRPDNLPEWAGKSFEADLAKLAGVPVTMENDTAMVGLGEAAYGAGKGASILVYITVSTGVNGVRIVDGRIDRSKEGFEIGGQYLATTGTVSLENLVSGKSIQERFGAHPKDLGKDNPVWEELAAVLAYGVHNTILHWSPDRVVLGGSMFNDIGIPVESVQRHVASIMRKFPEVPDIVHSSLGDVGGLWGGLARLKQAHA